MAKLRLDDIIKATGGELLNRELETFSGVSIDSRTIRAGDLFVPLPGEHCDGHDYLAQALERGAGALVSVVPSVSVEGKTVVRVKDTLKALQDTAKYLRTRHSGPVVAVTGTNGKTTTKELICSVLGIRHKVLKTTGNLNNHIGVPLCITRMDGDEDFMVIEMGSSAKGDIKFLCDIARPDYAVMTNVGQAHLEGFGDITAVRDTDLEVMGYARTFAVNADDRFLMDGTVSYKGRKITYGIEAAADVTARDIVLRERGSEFRLSLGGDRQFDVELALPGRFNISNALAAAAISDSLGISAEEIRLGFKSFAGVPMRLQMKELGGMLLIIDAYNANPASMEEAVRELSRLKRNRTIAVLGDMLELGAGAADSHAQLMVRLNDLQVDMLIATGTLMQQASAVFNGGCYRAEDPFQAGTILSDICREGDTILLKGSRGMRMEKALEEVEASLPGGSGNAL
ncbi:MAG: UDP-N-acetylmuramoyl-tripeptide--D-alanyl-D-alanine ligase [Nitrospirae bacterium]|nr:UDP-N-acetylmuramoyl-tripeptide--D-alanyl-D-alanine ligase [Nitrospirota bacterium]